MADSILNTRKKLGLWPRAAIISALVWSAPRVAHGDLGQMADNGSSTNAGATMTQLSDDARNAIKSIRASAPLRRGVTSIHVVDAATGSFVYSERADQALNPASNVKLISTATALDLLGPKWRYHTRLIGPAPQSGVIHGSVFLLGNSDPTLTVENLTQLAATLRRSGTTTITGDVVLSDDLYRDTLGSGTVRITVAAETSGPPLVTVQPASDFVRVVNRASTRSRGRSRVQVKTQIVEEASGPILEVTVSGRMRTGRKHVFARPVHRRSSFTGYTLRAVLQEAGIAVQGNVKIEGLATYLVDTAKNHGFPLPLATHASRPVGDIVRWVNKRSLNHLSDRLVMTAAAHTYGGTPTMAKAVTAMRDWMVRMGIGTDDVHLDSGSGLSYNTRLSAKKIVETLLAASGYRPGAKAANVFRESLAIGGVDGTLRYRFHDNDEQVIGKTGTLNGIIALSGFVTVGQRELCFAVVTNGTRHRTREQVRRAHEALVDVLHDHLREQNILVADR